DRYTLIPSIGLILALVASLPDASRKVAVIVGLAAASTCAVLTVRQLPFWKDEIVLWTRAIQVTQNNFAAENRLGRAYFTTERYAESVPHFREVNRIQPRYEEAYVNLAVALARAGMGDQV